MKKVLTICLILLTCLFMLFITLCTLSIFLKWPMYVSGYSSLFTSQFNARFVVLGFVLLLFAYVFDKKGKYLRPIMRLNLILAILFLVLQTAFTVVMYYTANKYQTSVSFFRGLKGYEKALESKETYTYLILDNERYDLDVYRPARQVEALSAPVILVHGGGFIKGNRTQVGYAAEWFTNRGYTLFAISYPLGTETRHSWKSAANAVATSMGYVAKNAAKFGIDPRKLILAGGSAGGALVMQADLGLRKGYVHAYDSLIAPIPRAVISIYPPVSLSALYRKTEEGKTIDLRHAAKKYLGGTPSEFPERYKHVNLIDQLSKGISPTLIVTGGIDHVVNVEATRTFVQKAQEMQLPVTYVEVPYGEHVFDANPNAMAGQIEWNKIEDFLKQQ